MIHDPQEAGWYTARRTSWSTLDAPVVVRVVPDEGNVTTVWRIGSRDPETLADWRLIDKVRANGDVRSIEVEALQREAHADGVKQGREEALRQPAEYAAQLARECPTFTADIADPEMREVGEPLLQLRMTASQAESISDGLSDLLCWTQGFKAALGRDDFDREPMGIETVRRVRETITKAQRAADKAKQQ